jgi:hypothetical protein
MSCYRELVDLREALDAAQQSIDRNHPSNGEWMAQIGALPAPGACGGFVGQRHACR